MEPISKEEFLKLPAKAQRAIQYEYMLEIHKKVHRNWLIDRAAAMIGGAFGGVMFLIGKAITFK